MPMKWAWTYVWRHLSKLLEHGFRILGKPSERSSWPQCQCQMIFNLKIEFTGFTTKLPAAKFLKNSKSGSSGCSLRYGKTNIVTSKAWVRKHLQSFTKYIKSQVLHLVLRLFFGKPIPFVKQKTNMFNWTKQKLIIWYWYFLIGLASFCRSQVRTRCRSFSSCLGNGNSTFGHPNRSISMALTWPLQP